MRIGVVLCDRANYGRLLPVAKSLVEDGHELKYLLSGSYVLERFGLPSLNCPLPGGIAEVLHTSVEGQKNITQASSLARSVELHARVLWGLHCVVIIGDRFEALGAACAAVQMRVPIIHFQGGEDSGIADDQHRWAITGMATYHVPATPQARIRLLKCGVHEDAILTVGCPSGDTCEKVRSEVSANGLTVIQYHPCEDDPPSMFEDTLTAVMDTGREFVCFWPNIDAGSERLMKTIRKRLNREPRTIKNLLPEDYYKLIGGADLLVGNSSAFCRDSSFFGTPTVLVGKRQRDRLGGYNVLRTELSEEIGTGIDKAVANGRYEPSTLFGDGHVSERFVKAIKEVPMIARRWKAGDVLTKQEESLVSV